MQWFQHSKAVKRQGAGLVIHGLNLKPRRMADVIAALNMAGIDALLLSLSGHGDNFKQREGTDAAEARLETFKSVSYQLWFQETLAAYEEVRSAARQEGVPLFLVGFSYGGLIGLDLLAARSDVCFDRALLFAPALSLHGWDYALRLLSPFPRLVLPTLAPEGYPANPGTPIAAYNALFETLDHFETHIGPQINIPTLVIIDPGDELVAFNGLRRIAKERHLDQWRFFAVRQRRSLLNGMLRHIIIDEASVGREAWTAVRNAMQAHVLKDAN